MSKFHRTIIGTVIVFKEKVMMPKMVGDIYGNNAYISLVKLKRT